MHKKQVNKIIQGFVLTLSLLFFMVSCGGPQPNRSQQLQEQKRKPLINVSGLEKKIHALINKERRRNGLSPLAWDDALAAIAGQHSKDMSKRKYFDHYSPEGRDFTYRYSQEGYQCAVRADNKIYLGAENIALNNLYDSVTTIDGKTFYDWNSQDKIAETTVQGWMKSPGHRKNILTPLWRHEGIGVVISPDDKVYITQNFC